MFTQTEKYKFKKYNRNYSKIFEKERISLSEIPQIKIEHIGSTAVNSLGGKGIIDIMVGTKKEFMKKISNEIQKKWYILINQETNRWFFEKDIRNNKFIRRIHIQLTPYKSIIWKNAIDFRDYLIKNKKAREEYAKIKKTASQLANGSGFAYRRHKNSFITKTLNKIKKLSQ